MNRSTKIALATILIVAALLRIVTALDCEAKPDFSDMAIYNAAALAEGIPSYPPPGYPLFLRAIYFIFGQLNYTAVFVVQSLLSIATVLLVFLSARNVFNERAGLFAAGLAAIYPRFIVYNLTTMTESLSIFLVTLMICFMTSDIRDTSKSLLSGSLIFIGFLIKPTLVFFAPGVFLVSRRRLVLLLTLGATFGSFFVYGIVAGESEKRGPMMLYKAYNPLAAKRTYFRMEDTELGADKDITDEEYVSAVKEFVKTNKWMTFDIIFKKSVTLVTRGWTRFVLQDIVGTNWILSQIMVYCYFPVLILGLVGMLRYANSGTRIITLTMFSYAVFHILITIFKKRYRLPIEPMLVVLAGMPLASIHYWNPLSGSDRADVISPLKKWTVSAIGTVVRSIKKAGEALTGVLRKDLDLILVIIFLALALRIYFAFAIEIQQLPHRSLILNNLALSGRISTSDAPLYPLFLRTIYSIFGTNNFTAVFIVQGLISTAGVVMLYIIVSRLWTGRAGIIAATLAAVYPRFLSYCIMVKPISVGIFLVITLLLLSRLSIPDRTRGILSGVIVGLAVMLEPLYIFLAPGTFAVIKNSRRAFLLTLLIILAPLAIWNSATERHIVPVYTSSAYRVDLRKFEMPDSPRLLNALYINISTILGRDWRDNYDSTMEPSVRNFNYINVYSYTLLMLIGLTGLIKYGTRKHLVTTFPVLVYITLLIFFTQLNDKIEARALWEPMLIMYGAMLLSRQGPSGGSIHT